jgi:CBS domain containing-hemolysin-like protein
MNTVYSLAAIILLLAANGFFVAAEFALVKARGFRIAARAEAGSPAARLTLRMQSKLEAYLAACQLGITMASLGLGWVGEPAVAALLEPLFHWAGMPPELLHTSAFITGFLIFSSLHIVIGEQVPKTFAIRQPEPVSVWVAYPLHLAYLLVYPLNWLLNKAASSILALFRVEQATHADVLSDEELKGLVATSREHGAIGEDKADMLRNLFEFDQSSVRRVMIPRASVLALDVSAPPDQNLALMRDGEHSRFPVIDSAANDALVGVLLAKDLFAAMLAGQWEPWKELARFCRPPLVVPEGQKLSRLFDSMRSERAHMAIVVDEYGEFTGIATLEDLLEEIVGEIEDETDVDDECPDIRPLADGGWEVDGLVSLNDLEREIGLQPTGELEANTLSGLCMERLERMPEPGDELTEAGFRIRVLSLEERRVGKVLIHRAQDPDTPQDQDSGDPGDGEG